MSEALLIAVLGYAVEYGIPAAQAIIKTWQTPSPTLEDWISALNKAQPYTSYVPAKPA